MPNSPPTPTMLQIGAVSKLTQLSIRTIRHYDSVGLVSPSGRSEGGFRLYTEQDVSRLALIRRMKPLGFSLEEMAELLRLVDAHRSSPTAETTEAMGGYVTLAEDRRTELAQMLAAADDFIGQLKEVAARSSAW